MSNTKIEVLQQPLNQAQLDMLAKMNFENTLMNLEKQKQAETALSLATINGISIQPVSAQQMQSVQQTQPLVQTQQIAQQASQTQPLFEQKTQTFSQQISIPPPVSQPFSLPQSQQVQLSQPVIQAQTAPQISQPVSQPIMQPVSQQITQTVPQQVSQTVTQFTPSPIQQAVISGLVTCASADFLPVEYNRNQFYRCTDNRLVAFNCPSNLVWNYSLRACDHSS